jgi:hypothetical protein
VGPVLTAFRTLLRRRPEVTLLTKHECPLCEEAARAVRAEFGASHVHMVNIIGDVELENEFVFRIPVLMFRNHVLAEGRITRPDARRALSVARLLARDESWSE